MKRFLSRKFLMALISGLLVVANSGLDLGLPEESVMSLAAIVISYVVGQGVVDAKKAAVSD